MMKKQNLPTQFSPFAWGIAVFCLPVLLWPLALLISPNLSKKPALSESQITWMSVFLWIYPFVLALLARIAYRLHSHKPKAAKGLLWIAALVFYCITIYVSAVGFH